MNEDYLSRLVKKKHSNSLPNELECCEISRVLKDRYDIAYFFIGSKITNGKLTKILSCVCLVQKKIKYDVLKSKSITSLPKTLSYFFKGKKKSLRTDIVECDPEIQLQGILNPGDRIETVDPSLFGTIGLVLQHADYGLVVTTAGHVIKDFNKSGYKSKDVFLNDLSTGQKISCLIKEYFVNGGVDYAFIKILENNAMIFSNSKIDEPYFQPKRTDQGCDLYVITRMQAIKTVFRGVQYAPINIRGEVFQNFIVTDDVTVKGDSGAALVDSDYRVWGLLIGSIRNSVDRQAGFSIFMPIEALFQRAAGKCNFIN